MLVMLSLTTYSCLWFGADTINRTSLYCIQLFRSPFNGHSYRLLLWRDGSLHFEKGPAPFCCSGISNSAYSQNVSSRSMNSTFTRSMPRPAGSGYYLPPDRQSPGMRRRKKWNVVYSKTSEISELRSESAQTPNRVLHGHPNHACLCYPHFTGFSETIRWVWCPFPARWISCCDGISRSKLRQGNRTRCCSVRVRPGLPDNVF